MVVVEVVEGDGFAVFGDVEVVAGEVEEELAGRIADEGVDVCVADVYLEGRFAGWWGVLCERGSEKQERQAEVLAQGLWLSVMIARGGGAWADCLGSLVIVVNTEAAVDSSEIIKRC